MPFVRRMLLRSASRDSKHAHYIARGRRLLGIVLTTGWPIRSTNFLWISTAIILALGIVALVVAAYCRFLRRKRAHLMQSVSLEQKKSTSVATASSDTSDGHGEISMTIKKSFSPTEREELHAATSSPAPGKCTLKSTNVPPASAPGLHGCLPFPAEDASTFDIKKFRASAPTRSILKMSQIFALPSLTYNYAGAAAAAEVEHPSAAILKLQLVDCCRCFRAFKEGDCVRVLPSCAHAFHMSCVDRWLPFHNTCPNCDVVVCAPQRKELPSIEQSLSFSFKNMVIQSDHHS